MLERISLLVLVGGALFENTTGVLNVQLDYLFPGSFYPLHFYGAWVFVAPFVTHAVLRVPAAIRTLRHLRDEESELLSPNPAPPTVSRRGALAFVGGGSLLLLATTADRSSTDRCGPRLCSPRTVGLNRVRVPAASRSTRRPRRAGSA